MLRPLCVCRDGVEPRLWPCCLVLRGPVLPCAGASSRLIRAPARSQRRTSTLDRASFAWLRRAKTMSIETRTLHGMLCLVTVRPIFACRSGQRRFDQSFSGIRLPDRREEQGSCQRQRGKTQKNTFSAWTSINRAPDRPYFNWVEPCRSQPGCPSSACVKLG